MQHSRQPAHRSGISWRGAIIAVMALLVLGTGKPVSAASNDSISGKAETYTGIFIGSGLVGNRIVDIEGFANWGQPGYRLDYGDNRFVAGMLLGTKFDLAGVRLRVEFDGAFGDLSGRSNRLDPEGLDETAGSDTDWVATWTRRVRAPHRGSNDVRHRRPGCGQDHEFRHRHRFGPRRAALHGPG